MRRVLHEAVLLYLGVHHPPEIVGALLLVLLQMLGPHLVHPVNLPHNLGRRHVAVHLGVAELQTDHIQLGPVSLQSTPWQSSPAPSGPHNPPEVGGGHWTLTEQPRHYPD